MFPPTTLTLPMRYSTLCSTHEIVGERGGNIVGRARRNCPRVRSDENEGLLQPIPYAVDFLLVYESYQALRRCVDPINDKEGTRLPHFLALRIVGVGNRLEADLDFAKQGLSRDFKGFMQHALKLSEAFGLFYIGPHKKGQAGRSSNTSNSRSGSSASKVADDGNKKPSF